MKASKKIVGNQRFNDGVRRVRESMSEPTNISTNNGV